MKSVPYFFYNCIDMKLTLTGNVSVLRLWLSYVRFTEYGTLQTNSFAELEDEYKIFLSPIFPSCSKDNLHVKRRTPHL